MLVSTPNDDWDFNLCGWSLAALLGFFGGFAFAPTTFFIPCMMWLSIVKPPRFSLSWILNYVSAINAPIKP